MKQYYVINISRYNGIEHEVVTSLKFKSGSLYQMRQDVMQVFRALSCINNNKNLCFDSELLLVTKNQNTKSQELTLIPYARYMNLRSLRIGFINLHKEREVFEGTYGFAKDIPLQHVTNSIFLLNLFADALADKGYTSFPRLLSDDADLTATTIWDRSIQYDTHMTKLLNERNKK